MAAPSGRSGATLTRKEERDAATRADRDGAWKEILEYYPERAVEFCFPRIHALVDWSRGVEFLDGTSVCQEHPLRRR